VTNSSTNIAFLNGDWIPAESLALPVIDVGFVQGVTVAERLRTFRGRLFQLDAHLQRLSRSLEIIGVSIPGGTDRLADPATELAERNHANLASGDDLGLCIFVTPGDYATYTGVAPTPRVVMHTYPVPFRQWASKYETGQRLAIPSVRQVPRNCWPTELKCRSRMHYYLADREAAIKLPGACALILDQDDSILEATTANVIAHFSDEGLVSPPEGTILPGISVAFLREMAREVGIDYVERVLHVEDLSKASEFLLTSTSPCVLPVVQCDDSQIGTGRPGPVFRSLLSAWSERVGVDVQQQANDFSNR
jgi:branched-chain amino acid aminotransferase